MLTPKQILKPVLSGGTVERTLLAPLTCVIASEVEGLSPREFLRSSTKLANTLRDLQRGLGLDIVVPESGSNIELEALGADLDWSSFPPRISTPPRETFDSHLEGLGRIPVLLDTIDRLKHMLGDRAAIGVALQGPQKLSALSGNHLTIADAAELILTVTRLVCSKGVDLIWILEDGSKPPTDQSNWLSLTAPIWGTIRFYQAVPALHLSGPSDGWLATVAELGGTAIPCVDPIQSPTLASAVREMGIYGAIVSVKGGQSGVESDETKIAVLREFTDGPGCLLLTSDDEWYGRVQARQLNSTTEKLKKMLKR
jgi:hypothetical protein